MSTVEPSGPVDPPAVVPDDPSRAVHSDQSNTDSGDPSAADPGQPSDGGTERPDQDGPTRRAADGPARQDVSKSVMGALASAGGALSTGWPEHLFQWVLLILAVVLGAAAPQTQVGDLVWRWARRLLSSWRPTRPLRLRRWLLMLMAVALAVASGRYIVAGGAFLADWGKVRISGCAAPTQLQVLTTPEELEPTRRIVDAYTVSTTTGNFGCPTVSMYVYAVPPAEAKGALETGWKDEAVARLGPRPDLWLPGSTRYVLNAATVSGSEQAPRTRSSTSLGSTPIVLALPAQRVRQDLQILFNGRSKTTWEEALDTLEGVGWGVARPDPVLSITGELATAAMYASGNGALVTRLEHPTAELNLVTLPRARGIEGQVARGLDDGAYPLGNAVDLLCHQRHRQDPNRPRVNGLVITEQQLVRFNSGASLGGGCPAGEPASPERSLFAIYPIDTLSLNHPLIEFDWRNRSPDQADGTDEDVQLDRADELRRWLGTTPGKRILNEVGLRPYDQPLTDPLSEQYGVRQGVAYSPITPSDQALDQVRGLREQAQRTSRVLVLLDASGSMNGPAGGGKQTRLDVAKHGVVQIADRMRGRDELGLWTFQGTAPKVRPRVGIATASTTAQGLSHRDAVGAALDRVGAGGATPLYDAMVQGVRAVKPSDADEPPESRPVPALVVLTDGADEGSATSADGLIEETRTAKVRVFVIAVGEASCANEALRAVTTSTGGGCYDTDFAGLDARLNTLFDTLWGGSR